MKNKSLLLGMQTLSSPWFVVSRVMVSLLFKKQMLGLPSILSKLPQERLCDVSPPQEERTQETETRGCPTKVSKGLSSWHPQNWYSSTWPDPSVGRVGKGDERSFLSPLHHK